MSEEINDNINEQHAEDHADGSHSRCTHEPGRFAEWRDEKGRFIKGHPGKAKGCRPKVSKELAERAFEKFNLHFEEIVENVLNSKRVDVQLKLISILMDRFAGRAAQKVSLDVEDATPVSELFADLMRQVADNDSSEPKDE